MISKKFSQNAKARLANYFLICIIILPAISIKTSLFSFVVLFLITVATLIANRFFIVTASATLLFQTAQLLNTTSLNAPIYHDQITALIKDPILSLSMTQGHLSLGSIIPSIIYVSIGFLLIKRAAKFNSNNFEKLTGLIAALMGITLSASPIQLTLKHPLNYIYDIATGKQDNKLIIEGKEIPLVKFKNDDAPRLILILGESQTGFEQSKIDRSVAPHTFDMEDKGHLVRFKNITQMASFTALAYQQIFKTMPYDRFEDDRYTLLQIPQTLKRPSLFASSRNMDWGGLAEMLEPRFDKLIDCNDIKNNCSVIDGADDKHFSSAIIPDFINDSEEFFIVWQMNGSHIPLENKSPDEFKKFDDDYLNSLHYSDSIIHKLISSLPQDTWVIFMSDHAHGHSGDTPFIHAFIYNNSRNLTKFKKSQYSRLTQMDILKTIFHLNGFEFNNVDAFDLLSENVPNNRRRKSFRFFNKNNVTYIDN